MNNIIVLLIISAVLMLVQMLHIPADSFFMSDATMVLGFLILAAYFAGRLTNLATMPRITGYILIGILCGPWVLKFVTPAHLERFRLIDELALALIAFTAGSELQLKNLTKRINSILLIILMQIIITIILTVAVILISKPMVAAFSHEKTILILGIGLLIGVISVAKSPAQTIAVIVETRARGTMTDTVLGVTVLKDIVVIILFTIALNSVHALLTPDESLDLGRLLFLLMEIGLSLVAGGVFGLIVILYMRNIKQELFLFILGMAFFVTTISHQLHLEFLLTAMSTGFVVQNFSECGEEFSRAVERTSLPVYLIFFSIAGASLNLPILYSLWPMALVIVFSRLTAIYLGTYSGARLAHDEHNVRHFAWSGFIGQAGVSLGFAIMVGEAIPSLGEVVKNMIIASIVINMIIGPVIFKWALGRVGETFTMRTKVRMAKSVS